MPILIHLRHRPLGEEVGGSLVPEQHALGGVVQAKVGAAVHNDALRGTIDQIK